jgi:hypothetical protein
MKKFIHLSELLYFANVPTSIILKDGSFIGGFNSINEASIYAAKKGLIYKEIVNKRLTLKY